MVFVGSKRMVQYDDTAADESIRVFDRGMEFKEPENFGEFQLSYRSGDIVVPRVEAAEPLSLELQDFARAILERSMCRARTRSSASRPSRRSRRRRRRCASAASRSGWSRRSSAPPPEGAVSGKGPEMRNGAVKPRRFRALLGVEIAKALILAGRTAHDRPWPSVRSGPKHLVPVANQADPVSQPRGAPPGGRARGDDRSGTGERRGRSWRPWATAPPGTSRCATCAGRRPRAWAARWRPRATFLADEPVFVGPGDALHRDQIHPHIAAFADEGIDALTLRLSGAPCDRSGTPLAGGWLLSRRAVCDPPPPATGRRRPDRRDPAPGRPGPRPGRGRVPALPRRPGRVAGGQPADARGACART